MWRRAYKVPRNPLISNVHTPLGRHYTLFNKPLIFNEFCLHTPFPHTPYALRGATGAHRERKPRT